MPAFSVAQTLPAHIIEHIALLISSPAYKWDTYRRGYQDVKRRELLRLACVCRAWWQLLHPLVYRTVALGLSDTDLIRRGNNLVTLRQAVAAGHKGHVRQINIYAGIIALGRSWASQSTDAAMLLGRCGDLPRVRSAVLDINIMLNADTALEAGRDAAADLIRSSANEFAALLDAGSRAMPNIRHVSVNNWAVTHHELGAEPGVLRTFLDVHGIVGAQVMHISLYGDAMITASLQSLPAGSLRSIVVNQDRDMGPATTLVRRNSETLERLEVALSNCTAAARLFSRDGDSGQPIVYPRLRCLEVRCAGLSSHETWQPEASPLPALEVLRSWGPLPFPPAVVILGARARLRSLEIPMLPDLRSLLPAHAAAGGDGFPNLERVTLDMSGDQQPSVSERAAWLSDLFRLSPKVWTVSIKDRRDHPLGDYCSTVRFPPGLQHLSIEEPLTVGQIMTIARGCPRLRTAAFVLADYPENNGGHAPTMAVIRQHRKQYRVHTSSLWRLVLYGQKFRHKVRLFQFMVLLADLLPSVTRVIAMRQLMALEWFWKQIRIARARSVYKDSAHLHKVEFVSRAYY